VHDHEPELWSELELGILMGPALRAYEAEQVAWDARVAQEKKNRGLRSPSFIALREDSGREGQISGRLRRVAGPWLLRV